LKDKQIFVHPVVPRRDLTPVPLFTSPLLSLHHIFIVAKYLLIVISLFPLNPTVHREKVENKQTSKMDSVQAVSASLTQMRILRCVRCISVGEHGDRKFSPTLKKEAAASP
jgi:hypothetical protein